MAESVVIFEDIFGASDSEDENFLGFNPEDINNIEVSEIDPDNSAFEVELDSDEIQTIDEELRAEERDPKFEAYDCGWLKKFTGGFGPKNIDSESTPVEIFAHFFDDEIIDFLVTETNLYYAQVLHSKGGVENLSKACHARSWTNVTNPEMKAFLGMTIYMGLVRLPNYDSYWGTDSLLSFKGFTSIMPRDRLLNILSFLHAADNTKEPVRDSPEYDPSYKISKLSLLLLMVLYYFHVSGNHSLKYQYHNSKNLFIVNF